MQRGNKNEPTKNKNINIILGATGQIGSAIADYFDLDALEQAVQGGK